MSLAWHIARKDLRRLGVPVGVWLAVILVPAIAFCAVSPAPEGNAVASIDMWRGVFSIWIRLLEGIQLFLGYLLAGTLVLEDAPVGTTSFWSTRPIGNARLLGAKVMATLVLFIVAPVVVLTPVWLASGFGLSDLAHAAWEFMTRFGAATLFALMTASLARSLAQFLLFSLVVVGLWIGSGIAAALFWQDAPMVVRASREWLVLSGALPMVAIVLVHQFLTRRAARTWMMIGGALVVATVIRSVWPWEIRGAITATRAAAPRPEDRAGEIVAAPAFTKYSANALPSLYGKTSWRPEGFSVPVFARWSDGSIEMKGERNGMWQSEAGLRALGLKRSTAPLAWQLHMLGSALPAFGAGPPQFTGSLEIWAVRTRVLGEMPVRRGAELRHEAGRARILEVVIRDERLEEIYLEERDPLARARAGWQTNWSLRDAGRARYIECYFLVNRATQHAQAWHAGELGSVEMNSLTLRFVRAAVAGPGWPKEWGEPVLVTVRFERDHAFEIPLEVHGVSSRGWEQIP